jgi:hypothetical protein
MAWLTVYGGQIEDHIGMRKGVEGQWLPHIAIEVPRPPRGEGILKCSRIALSTWRIQVGEHQFLNGSVAQKVLRKMRSDKSCPAKDDDNLHVDLVAFIPGNRRSD